MANRIVLIPNDDHPITIEQSDKHVVVKAAGVTLADTKRALKLSEASYPPVYYIPREDADLSLLARTDHATYCPYKGEASYFSIPAGGEHTINAVWSYESPFAAVAEIKGYLAFYPDRVEVTETQI